MRKGTFSLTNSLDPALYPASYRISLWKGSLKVLGPVVVFLIYVLLRTDFLTRDVSPSVLVLLSLCSLCLVLVFINVTFARITLTPDRIERVTFFGTKSMLRADVAGLERRRRLFIETPILVSKKGLLEGVQLPNGIETDAAWDAWMTVAQNIDTMPTKAAMIHGGRIALAVIALLVSLGCLITAFVMHIDVKRRATETPVIATIAKVRSQINKGDYIYFAQLSFDRKQGDGSMVHCDVPDVPFGMRRMTAGATIKVAPRAATCWDPDIICETCAAPSDSVALDMLMIAAISGLICFLLFWTKPRSENKPA